MKSNKCSLLELPRELRDIVHKHVLLRGVIPIECAIADPSISHDYPVESKAFSLHAPRIHRRIWSVPAFDLELDDSTNGRHAPSTVSMTYQYANCSKGRDTSMSNESSTDGVGPRDSITQGLSIDWLQVCKQIYAEAREVFYGHNIFSFTGDFRIPTAFSFLCDRPAASLCLITSLELALMEDSNIRGTSHAHYPVIRRATDSLVLQYSYHYFTELCTLLSTPRIRLRKLYLSVETMFTPGLDWQDSLVDSFKQEQNNIKGQETQPIWLDPLLNIGGLEMVELHWIFRPPRLLRMSRTVALMRQHLLVKTLKNSSSDGSAAGDFDGNRLEFRALHLTEDGHDVVSGGTRKWRHYSLHGDVVDLLRIEEEGDRKSGHRCPEVPQHMDWLLELYMGMWLLHCTLRSA